MRGWYTAAAGCLMIIAGFAVGSPRYEHESSRDKYFRLTVNLKYQDEDVQISYPVACRANVSRQLDGDVSVDGVGLTPFVFGREMSDGGALLVVTPEFCGAEYATSSKEEATRVPPDYNPIIIHFSDSSKPWFGLAYMEKQAYLSPHSVMRFVNSRVDQITAADWKAWRTSNPETNWATWQKMALDPNWFKTVSWKPGEKHVPTICYYGSLLPVPSAFEMRIAELRPKNRPYFWGSNEAEYELWAFINKPSKHRDGITLDGTPLWKFERGPTSPMLPKYPSKSVVSMNDLPPEGVIDPALIVRPEQLPVGESSSKLQGNSLDANDVIVKSEWRGFAFCNGSNKVAPGSYQRAFRGVTLRLNKVNGIRLQGEYIPNSDQGGFLGDDIKVSLGKLILFNSGGGL